MPVIIAVLLCASAGHAQTPTAPAPAETDAEAPLAVQLATVPGVQPGMTVDELIDVALQAIQAQRFDDAQMVLLVVSRRHPQNLRALGSLAYLYELRATAARGNTADPNAARTADAYLEAAITIYLNAAPLAIEKPDLRTAEQMYQTVLIHRPGNPEAQFGLARVLRGMERRLQAIEQYKSYLANPSARPDTLTQAYLELGQIYREQGYTSLALVTLEKGRSRNPDQVALLVELAMAYQDNNKFDKALELLQAATDKAPDHAGYRDAYAGILLKQAQRPRSPGAAGTGATARELLDQARNEAREAVGLAREALRRAPDDQRILGEINNFYGTYRAVLRGILANDPANTSIRLELVAAIQESAAIGETLNLHRALAVLEEAGESARKNIPLLEKLASLQYELYRRNAAAETCRRILEIDPNHEFARQMLEGIGPAPAGTPATAPG